MTGTLGDELTKHKINFSNIILCCKTIYSLIKVPALEFIVYRSTPIVNTHAQIYAHIHMCVCVCVSVRERESDGECVYIYN